MQDLKEKIRLYYEITIEIEELLDKENYKEVDIELDKRQEIIDSIDDTDKGIAQNIYRSMGLDKIDSKIRTMITQYLDETKKEIKEYRKTKAVNSMYSRNSKEKLNIFSKKV